MIICHPGYLSSIFMIQIGNEYFISNYLQENKHKNRLLDTSIFIIQLRLPDFIAHTK